MHQLGLLEMQRPQQLRPLLLLELLRLLPALIVQLSLVQCPQLLLPIEHLLLPCLFPLLLMRVGVCASCWSC